MDQDPFELDQQTLDKKLKLLQENFDRWRRLKSGAEDLTTEEELADAEDEFRWLTIEIEKSVKSIGWELDDLGETLRLMATRQPPKKTGPTAAPTGQSEARVQYIKNARGLLSAIEAEVKAGSARTERFADAGEDAPPEPSLISQPGSEPSLIGQQGSAPSLIGQQSQQLPAEQKMSASTERLVQSLLQQDEDDDDVELLIQDEDGGSRARRQFSVMVDDEETPMKRLWRRHKPVVCFVGLVLLLLFIIFIIAVTQGSRRSHASGSSGAAQTPTTPSAS